ncbi:MAG TPA: TIGR02678 family protein [Bacillota bacterium]|nr:TIGR02678 family protein [Bacillota bacterium]
MTHFDEKAQEALQILLEKFWILRLEEPELYQFVREREQVIRRYVDEKFGYNLFVHQYFIKLEKIPVTPKHWMGIQTFQEPRDYAMFSCALAYTENYAVDEQFLLSDICEDIKDMYPGDIPLDWTNYNHRRSLVRVIKQMEKLALIQTVEGETDRFALDEAQEVLYEVTVYVRYFMRSFPKELAAYESAEDILAADWRRHEEDYRRKRVYRQLITSPVVYREHENDLDFAYIRQFRNRLADDFASHTMFRLEVFKNAALLVADERKQLLTLFPDQKAIMDVALHVASYLREHQEDFTPDEFGKIKLSYDQFTHIIATVHDIYGKGWSKQYREGSLTSTVNDLLNILQEWEMADVDRVNNLVTILPLFGRVAGKYPKDFLQAEEG